MAAIAIIILQNFLTRLKETTPSSSPITKTALEINGSLLGHDLAAQCSKTIHRAQNKLKSPIKEDNIWARHDLTYDIVLIIISFGSLKSTIRSTQARRILRSHCFYDESKEWPICELYEKVGLLDTIIYCSLKLL